MDYRGVAGGFAVVVSVFGGVIAQINNSPVVTLGSVMLAFLGFASLAIKTFETWLNYQTDLKQLHDLRQEVAELQAWKAAGTCLMCPTCPHRVRPPEDY